MNDDTGHDRTIAAAYDRLGAAVHPPGDAPQRVARRIAVRRRRRRAAGGVAALAVAAVVGTAAVSTGGEPDRVVDPATERVPEPGPVSTLRTTLPDGSTYTFEEVEVTCEGGTITAQSPFRTTGETADGGLSEPYLFIEGEVDKLPAGRVLHLPVDGPGGSDTYPVVLFFALAGDREANELSSAVGGASGTVEVVEATCSPEPHLELRVDAVLGSEVEQEAMPLTGELR